MIYICLFGVLISTHFSGAVFAALLIQQGRPSGLLSTQNWVLPIQGISGYHESNTSAIYQHSCVLVDFILEIGCSNPSIWRCGL